LEGRRINEQVEKFRSSRVLVAGLMASLVMSFSGAYAQAGAQGALKLDEAKAKQAYSLGVQAYIWG
jgi:hypothetical protein